MQKAEVQSAKKDVHSTSFFRYSLLTELHTFAKINQIDFIVLN